VEGAVDTADEDAAVVATAPEESCMVGTADRVAGEVEKQANHEGDHRLTASVDVPYVSCPAEAVVSPVSAAMLVLENYVVQGLVHSLYVEDTAQEGAVSG
jgi:alkanesulfonate monooxygenase SsuD/methylene tetrahydromethanopterin reductase-like flavin-dependent oxidoreductase (luciferase family)